MSYQEKALAPFNDLDQLKTNRNWQLLIRLAAVDLAQICGFAIACLVKET